MGYYATMTAVKPICIIFVLYVNKYEIFEEFYLFYSVTLPANPLALRS